MIAGQANRAIVPGAEAQRVRQDMLDGIRPYISVGYRVLEYVLEKTGKDGDTYRATKWMPAEVSTVAVPADASVGVGRSDDGDAQPVIVRRSADLAEETNQQENRQMADKPTTEKTEEQRAAESAAETDRKVQAALTARNAEVAQITELAISNGCQERAAEFIASGKSPGEVGLLILAEKRSNPVTQSTSERAPGVITDKSKNPVYSMVRALAGAVGLREGKRWEGFESECDSEIRGKLPASYKQQGGIFVPERQGYTPPEVRRAMARMLGLHVSVISVGFGPPLWWTRWRGAPSPCRRRTPRSCRSCTPSGTPPTG